MTAALNGKPIYESPVASDSDVIAKSAVEPTQRRRSPAPREALDSFHPRSVRLLIALK